MLKQPKKIRFIQIASTDRECFVKREYDVPGDLSEELAQSFVKANHAVFVDPPAESVAPSPAPIKRK